MDELKRSAIRGGGRLNTILAAYEKGLLEDALRRCQGNVSQAARFLRVGRRTLYDKLQSHGIDLEGHTHWTGKPSAKREKQRRFCFKPTANC